MALRVALGARSYQIHIERSYEKLPHRLGALGLPRHLWVVSHRSLLARHGSALLGPLKRAGYAVGTITVPESELAKSSQVAERVMRTLARQAAMRLPVLLAFGGGVVGDLTGFVAAVFRRGVPYVQLPTTLLAQVDSSIGGKVGVDMPFAKNLIGAFYQPRLVVNHLGLLKTLPLRQRRSGFSEVIKYGVMSDERFFRFLEQHLEKCLAGEPSTANVMVERCCTIKARVVSRDERETKDLRLHLNLGHTLGHALESATGFRRFTHGEAIAIGMACVARMSAALGIMPDRDVIRLLGLLEAAGLPTRTDEVSLAQLKRTLLYDKKFTEGKPRWVLPVRIGKVTVSDVVPRSLMWRMIGEHVGHSGSRVR